MSGGQSPRLDVSHPGAGKFATSNIRYFFPYIPTVISIFLFVFLCGRRGFCHRACWISPIITFGTKIGTFVHSPSLHVMVKDSDACKNCRVCTEICPMSIDIHERVQARMRLPDNCIQCGLCIDRCSKGVLSFSFGIEKRCRWDTHFLKVEGMRHRWKVIQGDLFAFPHHHPLLLTEDPLLRKYGSNPG